MDITNLIVNMISGAVGGNAAGAAMPDKSLGTVGNSLAGLLGGGAGGAILQAILPALAQGGGGNLESIIGNIAGGGIGGGLLMMLTSMVKKYIAQAA
jgi:uncharacterized membrane protein YeaQ/YmgE (transglycosylase-associated protein family)